MSDLDPRTAYHLARRALTTARVAPDGRRSVWRGQYGPAVGPNAAVVRGALLAALGRDTLPRGSGDLPSRLARAVLAARAAAPEAGLAARLREFRRSRYLAEARRRGLPTSLSLAKAGDMPLQVEDECRTAEGHHVALLRAEGWAEYSRRAGNWRTSLAILAGRDDAGLWAVRVPGTLASAAAALEWLEPAAVRRAREEGRRVLRQGDVYVVERKRDGMDGADLPAGHRWEEATRTLVHDEHTRLPVPFPAMAFRQSTLAASGSARRRGD